MPPPHRPFAVTLCQAWGTSPIAPHVAAAVAANSMIFILFILFRSFCNLLVSQIVILQQLCLVAVCVTLR